MSIQGAGQLWEAELAPQQQSWLSGWVVAAKVKKKPSETSYPVRFNRETGFDILRPTKQTNLDTRVHCPKAHA